jgi:RHS repeat-associated protein
MKGEFMMNKLIGLFSYLLLIGLSTGAAFAADKVYFYHTDPAGTPIAMSNSTGAIAWKATYKPFGEEHSINPATIENNERFVGKEKDKETGLQYFGARYMKDKIGRFLSPDPVGPVDEKTNKTNYAMLTNPQRLNRYAYALNNPYRYVDPDGLFTITILEYGERSGPTYGAQIAVTGDNGKVARVQGSTWPNPNNPSPGISQGTYDAIYSTTGHRGTTNGVRLENGGEIPTLGPNPAQHNEEYATGVNIHHGYSSSNRGSAGCITIDPNHAPEVWNVLQNGETGTVTITRPAETNNNKTEEE